MSDDLGADPPAPEDHPELPFPEGVALRASTWSGPIPPPEQVRAFNEIHPELGTQLVREFLAETEHRRQLQRQELRTIDVATRRGQWMAFTIVLVLAVGSVVLGIMGHREVAIAVAGIDVAAPTIAFVVTRLRDRGDDGVA